MRFDYACGGERAERERGWVSVCALDGEALLEVCVARFSGNNLDALNDALRGGCGEVDPEGKTFVWKGHAAAKAALGEGFFDTVMEIFGDDNESGHQAFVVELQ